MISNAIFWGDRLKEMPEDKNFCCESISVDNFIPSVDINGYDATDTSTSLRA